VLFNDFDDAVCARFDQNGVVVHVSVAVAPYVVLGGHVVVRNTWRKHHADAKIVVIVVRGPSLMFDIFAEARTILNA
jgi:hypothetical protein